MGSRGSGSGNGDPCVHYLVSIKKFFASSRRNCCITSSNLLFSVVRSLGVADGGWEKKEGDLVISSRNDVVITMLEEWMCRES